MPRRERCVPPGIPCHITQRGVDRRPTFTGPGDHPIYLRLLTDHLADASVRLLAYCLMTNHVHLLAVPARENSFSVLLRRVHGRYAQYYNIRNGRTGHLWQNRYFACPLDEAHLRAALVYVERNPVRAGMVGRAEEYPWSSAAAHATGNDATGLLDMNWWHDEFAGLNWSEELAASTDESAARLRSCTFAGRPFGSDRFVEELSKRFDRHWAPGRPRKHPQCPDRSATGQALLFGD